jgi:hypothetical protein
MNFAKAAIKRRRSGDHFRPNRRQVGKNLFDFDPDLLPGLCGTRVIHGKPPRNSRAGIPKSDTTTIGATPSLEPAPTPSYASRREIQSRSEAREVNFFGRLSHGAQPAAALHPF